MPRTSTVLSREVRMIRQAIGQLTSALSKMSASLAGTISSNGNGPAQVKIAGRKRPLTPARRAALKLQGRYIGTIRMLPAAKKAKVKKVRDAKGVRAAIAYARRLAS